MGDKILAAIKRKCRDCSGGNAKEVEACQIKDCPLYVYRSGLPAAPARPKSKRRKAA